MKHILYCRACNLYTIKKNCPKCKKETITPKPPKFSPEDKYAGYRRKVKENSLKEKGFL